LHLPVHLSYSHHQHAPSPMTLHISSNKGWGYSHSNLCFRTTDCSIIGYSENRSTISST
jgi:hypothetical protein